MSDSPPAAARTLALLAAGLTAALIGAWAIREAGRTAVPHTEAATVLAAARPLPPFELVGADGRPFDRDALLGRYTFVFFGFSHCPDLCPATLTELALARRSLADLPAARLPAVVMVGIDQRRDTQPALARYVAHFDPGFTAVGGDAAAVRRLAAALGAVVDSPAAADEGYRVEHTAALFLIDPEAALAAVFPSPHVARTLAADYRSIVAGRGPT